MEQNEVLMNRVAELENQLASERQEFQTRPRLQDLGPEELATESVGAVAEIIKAARLQSFELKKTGRDELEQARTTAKEVSAQTEVYCNQLRADAESEASDRLAAARTKAEKVIANAINVADIKVKEARETAEALDADGRKQHAALIAESQARLESASARARRAVETANNVAQQTLTTARSTAAGIISEARTSARIAISQAVETLTQEGESFKAVMLEAEQMRSALALLTRPIMQSVESASASLSSLEAQADAAALRIDQTKYEVMAQVEQLGQGASDASGIQGGEILIIGRGEIPSIASSL